MAKKFFYACAGLFLLTLSFQLGARTAGAQGGGMIEVAGISYWNEPRPCAVVNRIIYYFYPVAGGWELRHSGDAIPGSARVIAAERDGAAVLENGDCYLLQGGNWVLVGNFLGQSTQTIKATWGSVKARYRER